MSGRQPSKHPAIDAGTLLLLAFLGALFAYLQLSALFDTTIMSGESAILSNVVIDYVRTGGWHYPFHAQHLFYPGVEKFMIHPPLHYFLAAQWVSLFGIGVWQLHLQSVLATLLGVGAATTFLWKTLGARIALLIPPLAAVSAGLLFSSLELRPELTFGFLHAFNVAILWLLLARPLTDRVRWALSFVFGLLTIATLATHWFGFCFQLYLVLFAAASLWKGGARAWPSLFASALGWTSGMAIWFFAFGKDLLPSLIFSLIKGNDFRNSIDISMANALSFLTSWPGGSWLLAGLILAVFSATTALFLRLQAHRAFEPEEAIGLFLIANILFYLVFFYFFVGNKSPRYASNIVFLLLPLAAIGYGVAARFIARRLRGPEITGFLTAALATAMLISSPVVRTFLTPFHGPTFSRESYAGLRNSLTTLVPTGVTTVLGGNAYPYLFDRDYESTMLLMAQHTLSSPGDLPLREMIQHYRNMSAKQYMDRPFSLEERRRSTADAGYIVVADSGHSWQNLFFDSSLWRDEFTEVGFVFSRDTPLKRPRFFPGYESNYPFKFHVFRRQGLPREKVKHDQQGPRLVSMNARAIFVAPGRFDRHAFALDLVWKELPPERKQLLLHEYLDASEWYGAILDASRKANIVNDLLPAVDGYLTTFQGLSSYGTPMTRTLANAVDHAFSIVGYPIDFPITPKEDWFE